MSVKLESRSEQAGHIPFDTEWEFDSDPVWHLTACTTKQRIQGAQVERSRYRYEFDAGNMLRRVSESEYLDAQGTLTSTYRSEIDVDPNPQLNAAELQPATYGVTSHSGGFFTALGAAKMAFVSVALVMALLSLPQRRKHALGSNLS